MLKFSFWLLFLVMALGCFVTAVTITITYIDPVTGNIILNLPEKSMVASIHPYNSNGLILLPITVMLLLFGMLAAKLEEKTDMIREENVV